MKRSKTQETWMWLVNFINVINQYPGWDIFTTQDVSSVGGNEKSTWDLSVLFLMTASKSKIILIKILIQNITLRHYFSPIILENYKAWHIVHLLRLWGKSYSHILPVEDEMSTFVDNWEIHNKIHVLTFWFSHYCKYLPRLKFSNNITYTSTVLFFYL